MRPSLPVLALAGTLILGVAGILLSPLATARSGSAEALTAAIDGFERAEPGTAVPDIVIEDETGAEVRLSDFRGQVVFLNFWATWCGPCKVEMPHIDALDSALGGADFKVLTVNTAERGPPERAKAWFDQQAFAALDFYRDPDWALFRALDLNNLPASFVIARDGTIIGQKLGIAEWHSDPIMRAFKAVIADGAEG